MIICTKYHNCFYVFLEFGMLNMSVFYHCYFKKKKKKKKKTANEKEIKILFPLNNYDIFLNDFV